MEVFGERFVKCISWSGSWMEGNISTTWMLTILLISTFIETFLSPAREEQRFKSNFRFNLSHSLMREFDPTLVYSRGHGMGEELGNFLICLMLPFLSVRSGAEIWCHGCLIPDPMLILFAQRLAEKLNVFTLFRKLTLKLKGDLIVTIAKNLPWLIFQKVLSKCINRKLVLWIKGMYCPKAKE